MDTETLVEVQIDDGQALLAELAKDGFDVSVACWIEPAADGEAYLYIASRCAVAENLNDAYGRVYDCLSRVANASISPGDIKLISHTHPIARDAIQIRARNATRTSARLRGSHLGNVAIREAYIYPPTGPMTPLDVLRTVVGLMNSDSPQSPIITLKDKSTLTGILTGVDSTAPGNLSIGIRDISTNSIRQLSVSDIVSIQ